MAVIIPFQQFLERRQRQRVQGLHEQCVKILQWNCAYAREMCENTTGFERSVWERRVAVFEGLLRYAERYP
ncbi:MAG: hypothetical protein KatS3mg077_1132 [Candidatus Binatia bacterium]|nr:MAG: hypothetical protein KatS3mg077_1132 [Candidatus Binatia bacterium]